VLEGMLIEERLGVARAQDVQGGSAQPDALLDEVVH
jgi:hypothetical protein